MFLYESIGDDKHTSIVTKALYHLSMDDRVKAMFAHTDCATLVSNLIYLSIIETLFQNLFKRSY